ncbi:alpha/beta fold hydrolase [Pseudobacteriovorax antillogorgiicola]|nr:alpha/beta hydrolase [Pseudobacteriovorax antillogorgiicola]
MGREKQWTYSQVKSKDGTAIRYGHWRGKTSSNHTLVFLNGRSEWLEKYEDIAKLIQVKPDCDILSWDHRGQGGSGGLRSHVDSYDEFLSDGRTVLEHALGSDTTYTIMAHSMGGLIALYGTLKKVFRPQQLILSSPLLMLPDQPIKRSIYIPASKVACRLTMARKSPGVGGQHDIYPGNSLTRSFSGFQRVQESPYPIPSPTFGWVNATDEAIRFVHDPKNLQGLLCPVLILGGSAEAVVDHRGFSHWVHEASKASDEPISFFNIPGARHELLNEIGRTITTARRNILYWMKQEGFKNEVFQD